MSKIIGYCRVSSKKQEDGNSLVQQQNEILNRYPYAIIAQEVFSGAKEREIFNKAMKSLEEGDTLVCLINCLKFN